MEVPSNHLIESSLDVGDEIKPQQQQQQQPAPPMTDSRQTPADPATSPAVATSPLPTSRRGDGVSSRAEYMTSPTATPVANGLVR